MHLTAKTQTSEPTQESVTDRPRRYIKPIERLSAGTKSNQHRQAHMTTALAAAVLSGDMFTTLAVDEIHKESTTKQRAEHMLREDFEPPNREYMQQCAAKDKWEAGEREERSIKCGGNKHHLQAQRYYLSNGSIESSVIGWAK